MTWVELHKFHVTGDTGGDWYIDLSRDADWVGEGTLENADCAITIAEEEWVKVVQGSLKPEMAVMMGKTKVAGDLALALKLKVLLN